MAHFETHKLERVREERERQYLEEQKSGKPSGTKVRDCAASLTVPSLILLPTKRGGKARAEADDDDAESVDSMAMEVDEPGSDFGSYSAHPQPGKKSATTSGKKVAAPAVSRRKASGSGKRKNAVSRALLSAIEV